MILAARRMGNGGPVLEVAGRKISQILVFHTLRRVSDSHLVVDICGRENFDTRLLSGIKVVRPCSQ